MSRGSLGWRRVSTVLTTVGEVGRHHRNRLLVSEGVAVSSITQRGFPSTRRKGLLTISPRKGVKREASLPRGAYRANLDDFQLHDPILVARQARKRDDTLSALHACQHAVSLHHEIAGKRHLHYPRWQPDLHGRVVDRQCAAVGHADGEATRAR